MRHSHGLSVCAGVFACLSVSAIELGSPFSDGMVLQRDMPVAIWGWAKPGEKVKASFGGKSASVKASKDGTWKLHLPAMKASDKPRVLTVNDLKINDVLVGEVWFAAGQSNMDCPLTYTGPRYRDRHGALMAQITDIPKVRFLSGDGGSWSATPLLRSKQRPTWKAFTAAHVGKSSAISAVGFYYARELYIALGIPVGLICIYSGGTGIDTWTPREGSATRPDLKDMAEWRYYNDSNWPTNWNQYPMRSTCQQPAALWNGRVNPIAPYTMRGVIWYQGCHNFNKGDWPRYCSKMHALHDGWRMKFENPHLRLYYAQLATSFETVGLQQAQYEKESQDSAMAVICDFGNPADIHPNDKEPVARRLLLKALKRDYGYANIEDCSPEVKSARVEGDKVILTMDHAKSLYIYNLDRGFKNNFELAGADGKWVRAEIVNLDPNYKKNHTVGGNVMGLEIQLQAKGVAAPTKVRHHIAAPYHSDVYNEVNLPLGPLVLDLTAQK